MFTDNSTYIIGQTVIVVNAIRYSLYPSSQCLPTSYMYKNSVKVVPAHAMMAYRGSRGITLAWH
jgi:hypothetical protein